MKSVSWIYQYLFFTGCLTASLVAQFTVSPMALEYFLEQGESGTSILQAKNNKSSPIELSVYIKDKAFINGKEAESEPGTFERSCAEWLFFTPKKITLDPGEVQEIRIKIEVPDTAKGMYWSSLFVEEISTPSNIQTRKIKGSMVSFGVSMRVGVLITQSVPGTIVKEGKVSEIYFEQQDSTANINFNYWNAGNAITFCNAWVEFRDIEGQTITKIDYGEFKSYPTQLHQIMVQIPNNLPAGEYSALGIIDFGGAQLVAGEVLFEYQGPNTE